MDYCLRSLVHILEQVMYPEQHYKHWVLDHAKIPQIRSLLENATFLRDFFDNTSPLILRTIESLEDQIMEAAGKAEDAIETHITDQILSNLERQSFMLSPPDLGEVIRTFEVAKQEVIKVKDADQRWGGVPAPVSSTRYPDSNNMVVGVTEELNQLRSRLTARAPELNIIPIVGMGGSGKTTLARILYDEHSSSTSYFDCCAWVTLSQSYDPKEILQKLVDLIGKPLSGMPQQGTDDVIARLHKTLFKRRYLIVLDDIWSCEAWDDFQRAFPENNNRSRIILTTREGTLANHVNSSSHQMHYLSKADSWKLIRGKVFGEHTIPRELEEVGKRIALKCGGLPLALQVIAGLLSQSEKNKEFWEHVAFSVSSLIAETNDQFSGIFSWSFAILPHYLKPCFLYMGAFPEDHEISVSTITQLCIAEGFVYPIPGKSLEQVVEIHMNALVDRNLIFVRKWRNNGKTKSYGIHDLLRNLCLRKAQEKKFICFKDSKTDILQEDIVHLRRVCVQLSGDEKDEFGPLKLTSLARSFRLIGYEASNRFVSRLCFKSSLLRVLHAHPSTISEFHKVLLHLVNLRYLSLWLGKGVLPASVSILRNLQTLIVNKLESIMILEDLPQLRHLRFIHLEQRSYEKPFHVHENLQSLSLIPLETLTSLLGKLPNLIKLGTNGSNSNDNIDFSCFQKLENLYCVNGYRSNNMYFPKNTRFPHTIKKLRIRAHNITQTVIDAVGILPSLEILKLDYLYFENETWEPAEGGFCQLRYLKITDSYLKNWPATEFHFPVLGHLIIDNCRDLTEIPIDIGGIQTLEIIEVDNCKTCVFESAKRIFDEQAEFGNTLLQLRLGHSLEEEREGEEDEIKAMVTRKNALFLNSYSFRSTTILPQFLKSLKLYNCVLSQTGLEAIGYLPQLDFLKFQHSEFESLTWEPTEGGFGKLQCLKIRGVNLKNWVATEIEYPVLHRLVLKECDGLDEIPNRLGRIETLESLELDECYPDLFDSAKKILEEQRQLGNNLLQLRLHTVKEYEYDYDDEEEED